MRVSSRLLGSPPPCTWASAEWCVRIELCKSPWHHRVVGRGRWCPGHIGSSAPSGTCSHRAGPASGGRTPACRSSHSLHSASVWLLVAWKNQTQVRAKRKSCFPPHANRSWLILFMLLVYKISVYKVRQRHGRFWVINCECIIIYNNSSSKAENVYMQEAVLLSWSTL